MDSINPVSRQGAYRIPFNSNHGADTPDWRLGRIREIEETREKRQNQLYGVVIEGRRGLSKTDIKAFSDSKLKRKQLEEAKAAPTTISGNFGVSKRQWGADGADAEDSDFDLPREFRRGSRNVGGNESGTRISYYD